jgi:hypothetical protein
VTKSQSKKLFSQDNDSSIDRYVTSFNLAKASFEKRKILKENL